MQNGAILQKHRHPDAASALVMGFAGQSAGPGDVTMTGGVGAIAPFAEDPLRAGVGFAEGEIIGGDVQFALGKALFRNRKLVHESEAELLFFGGEIDAQEAAGGALGGFPTNLAAESGFVASSLDPGQVFEEKEEDRFET